MESVSSLIIKDIKKSRNRVKRVQTFKDQDFTTLIENVKEITDKEIDELPERGKKGRRAK